MIKRGCDNCRKNINATVCAHFRRSIRDVYLEDNCTFWHPSRAVVKECRKKNKEFNQRRQNEL